MPVMGLQGLEGYFGGVNPFGEGTIPGAGGMLNMNRVKANMNPFQNSWDGDKFNIGKPQVNGGPGGSNLPPVPSGGVPAGAGAAEPGMQNMNPFLMAQMGMGMMGGNNQRMQVSDLRPMPQMPQMPHTQMQPIQTGQMRRNPFRGL